MRKHLIILVFFISNCQAPLAQKTGSASQKVDSFVQEYMQLSRLGPGYSRDISPDIIDQFKALFKKDAFLFWDLCKSAPDRLIPPLSFAEYIDLAKKTYHIKQPVLDYPDETIRMREDGKYAVVYLTKINHILDQEDKLLYENKLKLRISINLNEERLLIQNIVEDRRIVFVRSISVGANVIAWSNVFSSLSSHPVIRVGPNEQFKEFHMTAGISFLTGVLMEMRLNNDVRYGLTFSTGIFYSQLPLFSSMKDYSKSFTDTLDKNSANPITCTTFERSPEVREKIIVTKIEIPLLFKSYLNEWIYLKPGAALCFVTGKSDVDYVLSRAGGGLVTDLATLDQFYLDKEHELDQSSYGYYRNNRFRFSKETFSNKMILSFQLAVGIEKQFSYFSFGLEPNISFGMNPLSRRTLTGDYPLNNLKRFNSILESTRMPAFEFAFGVRLLISYIFKS